MELEFTAEQEELRESVRSVLARECPITLVRDMVEGGGRADALWKRIVGLDWPALTVPADDGGMGFGMVELAVLMEESGAVVAPVPLWSTIGLFVPAVREAGSSEQRERFLGAVATGTCVGTAAVAEKAGIWTSNAVTATGTRSGGSIVLRGAKHYVPDADVADEIVVAVRIDGEVRFVVVPSSAVSPERLHALDATRPLCALPLDGVTVDADRLLEGTGVLDRVLDEATAALSLELVGTCATITSIAVEYAKNREQFGVKIGSFQAIKHKLADMYVALEAARATSYFAAAAIAEDDPRRALAVAMAKVEASECARKVHAEGIQTLGGIGYTWEHDMQLYVKRAISSAALLGDAGYHRRRVAELLGVTATDANVG